MTHIHPHWETVEEVPVRYSPSARTVVAASPYSRSLAAILGIITVLSVGYFLYVKTGSLTAQLANDVHEVHIHAGGFNPASITVPPGAQVIWINDDEKPHILSSETLETNEGILYTSPIFPGSSYTIVLPEGIGFGEYQYISLTDSSFAGVVIVGDAPPQLPSSPPSPSLPPPPQTQAPAPSSVIAPNPNALGASVLPASQSVQTTMTAPVTTKPFRQPQTGASEWVIGALSLIVLTIMVRRMFVLQ
ncbi:hypothetical protein COU77_01675 [Candidatus Peregrinibacteria bacterium CG10_big_fil_rev_8_21_14_0_10_49_16]|nr:MAG: hypothetical protein COU77_01675 [Candidatus Peregrinibacteria bacterium CG10_big_fil_rev_8_21_14_0_10_49_16]